MKRLANKIFVTASTRNKYRSIYADDELEEEAGTEFGDPDDEQLSGDTEEDFNKLIEKLRDTSYTELGDALEDVVSDPKLYALFSEGFGNGELANVKMSTSTVGIPVTQLLPSQSEIGLDNSLKFPLHQDCSKLLSDGTITIVTPIVTYRKTFVVDGHHRWSQLYMINPKARVAAINFNYSEQSPYRILRNFQGAIATANKKVPKSFSKVNNVYEMSEDAIANYIDSNMEDVCWKSLVEAGVCKDREGAVDYITGNAMDLKNDNPPFANAPEREFMPQTNEKSIKIAEEGQTNI